MIVFALFSDAFLRMVLYAVFEVLTTRKPTFMLIIDGYVPIVTLSFTVPWIDTNFPKT